MVPNLLTSVFLLDEHGLEIEVFLVPLCSNNVFHEILQPQVLAFPRVLISEEIVRAVRLLGEEFRPGDVDEDVALMRQAAIINDVIPSLRSERRLVFVPFVSERLS